MFKFILFVLAVCAGVLGYGWWQASTHASFHADFRLLNHQRPSTQEPVMPGAQVHFLDAGGDTLAQGVNDELHNYIHLIHPEVGDCHDLERAATTSSDGRAAWQACYETLSSWTASWIRKVRQVAVRLEDCQFAPRPAEVAEYYADWYLWWLPLPHVGGTLYRHYRLRMEVDMENCSGGGADGDGEHT